MPMRVVDLVMPSSQLWPECWLKEKEDRYQSMQQLVRDLLRAQEGKRVYAEGLTLEELEQPLFEVDKQSCLAPGASWRSAKKMVIAAGFVFFVFYFVAWYVFCGASRQQNKYRHQKPAL
jgi:hypothetical protein